MNERRIAARQSRVAYPTRLNPIANRSGALNDELAGFAALSELCRRETASANKPYRTKKAINDTGHDSETIVCYVRTVGDVRVVDAIVSRSAGVLTLVASIRVLHRTLNRLCRHSAVRRHTRLVCKPTLSQKNKTRNYCS